MALRSFGTDARQDIRRALLDGKSKVRLKCLVRDSKAT